MRGRLKVRRGYGEGEARCESELKAEEVLVRRRRVSIAKRYIMAVSNACASEG